MGRCDIATICVGVADPRGSIKTEMIQFSRSSKCFNVVFYYLLVLYNDPRLPFASIVFALANDVMLDVHASISRHDPTNNCK